MATADIVYSRTAYFNRETSGIGCLYQFNIRRTTAILYIPVINNLGYLKTFTLFNNDCVGRSHVAMAATCIGYYHIIFTRCISPISCTGRTYNCNIRTSHFIPLITYTGISRVSGYRHLHITTILSSRNCSCHIITVSCYRNRISYCYFFITAGLCQCCSNRR